MKVLFVSDNHGDREILAQITRQFGDQVDAMFHCGDSNLNPTDEVMKPFKTVLGNTDWGLDYPKMQQSVIDNERIVVIHGHQYQVNSTLTPLMLLAQEQQASIIAYGHTHQLAATVEKGILLLNPGSISQPRGQYQKIGGTFAVVETTLRDFRIQYYDRQMTPVESLRLTLLRS